MVDETADELDRDLGTGLQPLPPPPRLLDDRDDRYDLERRIEQLERRSSRQEHMFKRILDLLEANATGRA
jgi:hypothetical protein